MCKKITKTNAGADIISAMEQEPFEKRASPRSHRSRKNFLVQMTTAAVMCLFLSTADLFADQVIMQTSIDEVRIDIGFQQENAISNDDFISIAWGDGTTSNVRDAEILERRSTKFFWFLFTHKYRDKKLHTIVISSSRIEYLECNRNQLTSLDVSNCTFLGDLQCNYNQLTSLDVSKCTYLQSFQCNNNQLTSLDVSNCTLLKMLGCGGNQFRSLDVSRCTALRLLQVNGCPLLETLNVSNDVSITSLNCPRLQIKLPNPKGTISVNMRNSSYGNTVVTPYDFESGFYIGSDNNFHSSNTSPHEGSFYKFTTIGKVNCLRDVIDNGISSATGWTDIAAVTPGYGYIAKYRYMIHSERENSTMWEDRYICIYVVREIIEATEYRGVLGAEIEYIEWY